ncbi:hypothetical protein AVEN_32666-1 [Araneus ventricosus]|uniref:Uncharacterized protein n=1 Tax=Araneus ventricosus TaxID=182803 RepID=A0A4Y2C9I2_ARAVE|nr:hypothetical protein AVEN_32666-1 [Araneus ventricosus]
MSVKKRGIRKISILLSPIKSSTVGSISISEIRENEKTMLRKCDLFDKELLSKDVKEVKSFKKTRKSSLASKARKKLEALDGASDNSRQNGSHTSENKKAGKKIDPLKRRISRSSTLSKKLKSASTACSLSDGESLVLKGIAVENEVNHPNNKSGKRQSYVSKKKTASHMVYGKDSDLEEHEMMKSTGNRDAATEEMDKENYEFESEPMQYERSKTATMPEMEREKRDTKQVNVKSSAVSKVSVDFSLEPAEILRSKYKTLYSGYRPKKNNEKVLNSTGLKQENTEPKRKKGKPSRRSLRIARIENEVYGIPRRSVRIAAMEKNK